jgi:hypothetical protein
MILISVLLILVGIQNINHTDKEIVWIIIIGILVLICFLLSRTFIMYIKNGYSRDLHNNFLIFTFIFASLPILAGFKLFYVILIGNSSDWSEIDFKSLTSFALMTLFIALFFLNMIKPKNK